AASKERRALRRACRRALQSAQTAVYRRPGARRTMLFRQRTAQKTLPVYAKVAGRFRVGVSGCRDVGMSGCRGVGVSGCRGVGVSGCRGVGVSGCRGVGVSERRRLSGCDADPSPARRTGCLDARLAADDTAANDASASTRSYCPPAATHGCGARTSHAGIEARLMRGWRSAAACPPSTAFAESERTVSKKSVRPYTDHVRTKWLGGFQELPRVALGHCQSIRRVKSACSQPAGHACTITVDAVRVEQLRRALPVFGPPAISGNTRAHRC
ncbi:hypothetical protein SAMN05216551_1101, partial [Chitinasiproducens palmae]